jgi:hypothetical protein
MCSPLDINGNHICNILDLADIGLHWNEADAPDRIPEGINGDEVANIFISDAIQRCNTIPALNILK